MEIFLRIALSRTSSCQSEQLTDAITCQGDEDIAIDSQVIQTTGDAIIVQGNCTITVTNSQITAGGNALGIQGNGDIIISDTKSQELATLSLFKETERLKQQASISPEAP